MDGIRVHRAESGKDTCHRSNNERTCSRPNSLTVRLTIQKPRAPYTERRQHHVAGQNRVFCPLGQRKINLGATASENVKDPKQQAHGSSCICKRDDGLTCRLDVPAHTMPQECSHVRRIVQQDDRRFCRRCARAQGFRIEPIVPRNHAIKCSPDLHRKEGAEHKDKDADEAAYPQPNSSPGAFCNTHLNRSACYRLNVEKKINFIGNK